MADDVIVGLGTRADFVATVPNVDARKLALTADEQVIFVCIGRASPINEVITRSGFGEAKAIALLLSLRAKGVIAPAKVSQPSKSSAPIDAATAEEVELDADRKQEILELDRTIDGMNHFEVLKVQPTATADEIRRAYHDASKRFHPDRFYNRNIGSFRARIDRIFRRISEANIVLSDPQKRLSYLRQNPELEAAARAPAAGKPEQPPEPLTQEQEARAAERRARMAHHPYLARARRGSALITEARAAIAKGDFMEANSRLNLAAQADPANVEIQRLLGDTKKRADMQRAERELKTAREAEQRGDRAAAIASYRMVAGTGDGQAFAASRVAELLLANGGEDLREAKNFAQKATDLEPRNGDYRVLLSRVLYELDMKKMARRELDEALRVNPDHAGAKALFRKLRWTF